MKQTIIKLLEERTQNISTNKYESGLSAGDISTILGEKRNTVSKYLNKMYEEDKLIKILKRPVRFLSKKVLLAAGYKITKKEYLRVQDILGLKSRLGFEKLIGSKGSLKTAVQQIESAIMYPRNGLPFILFGASGSGKSYIVDLAHEYALNNKCLEKGAPLVTLNCAQYADNPELLSSVLFGYKKGSFTGADKDKLGLLAAANGGILFLDEVHRLSPESQEKLFVFMDKGRYSPVGEVKEFQQAKVRLVFATTESKEKFLLTTFVRRIPVQIELPELMERDEKERLEMIYQFFKKEAGILATPISISNRAVRVLLNHKFKGNVGELKNRIKYLCAFQYRKRTNEHQIFINTSVLPIDLYPFSESSQQMGQLRNIQINAETNIWELDGLDVSTNKSKIDCLVDELSLIFQEAKTPISKNEVLKSVLPKVDLLMDRMLFNQPNEKNRLVLQMINRKVKSLIEFLEEEHSLKLFTNSVYSISSYLFYRIQQTNFEESRTESSPSKIREFLIRNFSEDYERVQSLIFLLENKFDIYLTAKDEIILSFYIISSNLSDKQNRPIKALVLAHGFATASSLANVGNRLLNQHIFDAFDLPLNSTTQEFSESVDSFISKNKNCSEFIILVDMGSLQEIQQFIQLKNSITIGIINNVTTSIVLQVGELIISEKLPEEIIQKVKANYKIEAKIYVPLIKKQQVIITTCLTGVGTASHIQQLLEESIDKAYGIDIKVMDYRRLKNDGIGEELAGAKIIAIIGTDNPKVKNIRYIPLEKLISGEDGALTAALADSLSSEEIQKINRKLIKNFSLEKVIESITILDSEILINELEEIIAQLEVLLDRKIENKIQMTLYIHMSCQIERLIRNQPITGFSPDKVAEIPTKFFEVMRRVFSGMEKKYSVTIPQAELVYLYSILYDYQ